MTSENDVAEALAVDGNEIVYVGDEAGLEAFVGSGTKVIDLEGGMVVPGFMDGHIHAPGDWAVSYTHLDVYKRQLFGRLRAVLPDVRLLPCHQENHRDHEGAPRQVGAGERGA